MASFCMERLLFVKKFTLYFRRLNFFLWSIVIVLLLPQVHCQKPPVYTAESCSNESVFLFFSTKSEQTAIQQSHIINPLLTSFARSVRESIAFGFYRTDLAPSSLGLYENLRQYFPVQTSHSVNKSLISNIRIFKICKTKHVKFNKSVYSHQRMSYTAESTINRVLRQRLGFVVFIDFL